MRALTKTIRVGALRHSVQIAAPTPGAQDSMGGVSPDDRSQWTVALTTWASIDAWTGDATTTANQVLSTSTHQIVIRHPRSFTPSNRHKIWFKDFTGKNRTFQIDAVLNPTETNKLLVLVCTEVNESNG